MDDCVQLWCQTSVSPLRLGKTSQNIGYTQSCTFVAFLELLLAFFLSTCDVMM